MCCFLVLWESMDFSALHTTSRYHINVQNAGCSACVDAAVLENRLVREEKMSFGFIRTVLEDRETERTSGVL